MRYSDRYGVAAYASVCGFLMNKDDSLANPQDRKQRMENKGVRRELISAMTVYAVAVLLSLAGPIYVMRLWEADLSIPFQYSGDAVAIEALVKSGVDNNWYLHNDFIGAPYGRDFYDYPISDNNLHLLWLKVLSLLTGNHFAATNIYYLITFPLTAAAALFVFRHFKIASVPAVVASLLFTFLPWHFMRGIAHLFLAAYYIVPLAVMVCLWIYSDSPPLSGLSIKKWKLKLNGLNRKDMASVLICALLGAAGIYYALFTIYSIAVSSMAAAVSEKTWKRLALGFALCLIIAASVFINISPSLIYYWTHDQNPEAVVRNPAEAETYGLKITHLLLPASGHRLPFFNKIKHAYYKSSTLNESDDSTLGLIASVGFLSLIYILLFKRSRDISLKNMDCLSVLNVAALLLAIIGGLGAILAFVFPYIRAYNRISIFIAFFSFFAVAVFLDRLWQKYTTSPILRVLAYAAAGLLLIFGTADQTNKTYCPAYLGIKARFTSDSQFVKNIEASVPRGSLVFQLPYHAFPEAGPANLMDDYDLFIPYLHSSGLKWSYGGMRGRPGDLWQRAVVSKPLPEMLEILAVTGFSGVYIDRNGFRDRAAELEKQLSDLLRIRPLVSENMRQSFFNIEPYRETLKQELPPSVWETKRDRAQYLILDSWTGGFYGIERSNNESWRWCSNRGQLVLVNNSPQQRTVVIDMEIQTGYEQPSELVLSGDLLTASLAVNSRGAHFSSQVNVPPGSHIINFSCNAEKVEAPQDPRYMVFRVINYRLTEVQ
ncbi:MAG TPA: hypothetical protein VNN73_11845 [Blastocatellia bacterium]|nr:hypothetical protein [Blastocatellia bacterium]